MHTQLTVYIKCKVERSRTFWQYAHIPFRGVYVYLFCKQIELKVLYEVYGIGIGVVQYFAQVMQETIQFALLRGYCALLILPVGGKSFLRDLVHTAGPYLHLYPAATGAHYRGMQRLIAIALRHAYPVAKALITGMVEVGDDGVYLPAIFLFPLGRRLKDNADGKKIIHLIKGHMLFAHLIPDRVYCLGPTVYLKVKTIIGQFFFYRLYKLIDIPCTVALGIFQPFCYLCVYLGLGILHRQVFHLRLYLVKAQSVCQRRIDVSSFRRYFQLLLPVHTVQCTHIVQAVGQLYEYHARIIGQGQ